MFNENVNKFWGDVRFQTGIFLDEVTLFMLKEAGAAFYGSTIKREERKIKYTFNITFPDS